MTPNSEWRTGVGASVIVVAVVASLFYVDLPGQSRLSGAAQDAGHVVATGVIAVCLLAILRQVPATRMLGVAGQYLTAFVAAGLLGLLVELVQQWGGRDAELGDVLRDVSGAFVFLAFAAIIDPALLEYDRRNRRTIRIVLAMVATVLLLVALGDLLSWSVAYMYRNQRFPEIARFDSHWSTKFIITDQHDLGFVAPPSGWRTANLQRVGRLTLSPAKYAGFSVEEPYPDWRGYDELVIDLYSEEELEYSLSIRVHDAVHTDAHADRFNRKFKVRPGVNRISIPLADIAEAPRGRSMRLDAIAGIGVFTVNPPEPLTLFVSSVRLE